MKKPFLPKLNASIIEIPEEHTRKIWSQFQRDLSKIGIVDSEDLGEQFDVNNVFTRVKTVLLDLSKNREEGFWQLLYVVDLPEAFLSSIEQSEAGIIELSRIVMIREWQKVILRQHFSAS